MLNGNGEYFDSDDRVNEIRNGRLCILWETAERETKEGYSYSVLRVKAEKRIVFFNLSEFRMLVSSSTRRSSEEAILLLVKVIWRPEKMVKNLMKEEREGGHGGF